MNKIWIDSNFYIVYVGWNGTGDMKMKHYQIKNIHDEFIGKIKVMVNESPIDKAKEYINGINIDD